MNEYEKQKHKLDVQIKRLEIERAKHNAAARKQRSHNMYTFAGEIERIYYSANKKKLFVSDSAAEAAQAEILKLIKNYYAAASNFY